MQNVSSGALVSSEQFLTIVLCSAIIFIILCMLGMVSNAINIKTFMAIGLNDGVTVSFFILSILDFLYLLSTLGLGVGAVFYVIEFLSNRLFPIEPFGVSAVVGNTNRLSNIANVLTTTYLAIARCMCVVKPLQFRNTFTRQRSLVIILGFCVFALASYTPVIATLRFVNGLDRRANVSRLILYVSTNREKTKVVVWMMTELILPLATQVIIILCVVVMARSLQVAAAFRRSSTATGGKIRTLVTDNSNNSDKLTGKDMRVVQQVVLISTVYIVCNTPKIMVSLAVVTAPNFSFGQRYSNLYTATNLFKVYFEMLNAAVNVFIYYRYNTKFRSLCAL